MVLPPSSPAATRCPPDTCLPSLRSGRPFKSPIGAKNTHTPEGVWVFLAEMEGFEPPHALRRLADFESAPFSHLGTSPYSFRKAHYSNPCIKNQALRLLFCQFQNFIHISADILVILPAVWPQAGGAVFNSAFRIGKITTAVFSQGIQRAKAEQAAEMIRIRSPMAGKIFTFFVLKKIIMRHSCLLHKKRAAPKDRASIEKRTSHSLYIIFFTLKIPSNLSIFKCKSLCYNILIQPSRDKSPAAQAGIPSVYPFWGGQKRFYETTGQCCSRLH